MVSLVMIGKKCPACEKRTRKKANFCSNCGYNYRKKQENSGMIGMNDLLGDIKMPFGLNGIMKSLVKQLDKELGSLDINEINNVQPKSFKIQISNRPPQIKPIEKIEQPTLEDVDEISPRESARRQSLPKVDAISTIRRLPEGIVYEISVPGVKHKKDVVVSQLEDGIEVRVYSKTKCYLKTIPVKAEILGYKVDSEKVLLKLKA